MPSINIFTWNTQGDKYRILRPIFDKELKFGGGRNFSIDVANIQEGGNPFCMMQTRINRYTGNRKVFQYKKKRFLKKENGRRLQDYSIVYWNNNLGGNARCSLLTMTKGSTSPAISFFIDTTQNGRRRLRPAMNLRYRNRIFCNVHIPSGYNNFSLSTRNDYANDFGNSLFFMIGDMNSNPRVRNPNLQGGGVHHNLKNAINIIYPSERTQRGGNTLDYMLSNTTNILPQETIFVNTMRNVSDHFLVLFPSVQI